MAKRLYADKEIRISYFPSLAGGIYSVCVQRRIKREGKMGIKLGFLLDEEAFTTLSKSDTKEGFQHDLYRLNHEGLVHLIIGKRLELTSRDLGRVYDCLIKAREIPEEEVSLTREVDEITGMEDDLRGLKELDEAFHIEPGESL